MRLKYPLEEFDAELETAEREAETEFAAADLADEIKQRHLNDLGIIYCLRKKDCDTVRNKVMCLFASVYAKISSSLCSRSIT